MARLPTGADASGVVHLATYQRDGKLSNNPLCWVMGWMPWLTPVRIVRRVKGAAPTCLWCVALSRRSR